MWCAMKTREVFSSAVVLIGKKLTENDTDMTDDQENVIKNWGDTEFIGLLYVVVTYLTP